MFDYARSFVSVSAYFVFMGSAIMTFGFEWANPEISFLNAF